MTVLRQTVGFLFIAALGSCSTPVPLGPNGFLTGTWESNSPGGSLSMTLEADGGIAHGTVLEVCCGTEGITSTGTVSGTYGGGGFTLNVDWPDYEQSGPERVTWTGHLTTFGAADALVGSWTETAPLDTVWGTLALLRVNAVPMNDASFGATQSLRLPDKRLEPTRREDYGMKDLIPTPRGSGAIR